MTDIPPVFLKRTGLIPAPELRATCRADGLDRTTTVFGQRAWLVSRAEDVRTVLCDATLFTADDSMPVPESADKIDDLLLTARPCRLAEEADMTEFVDVPGGRIAYEVTGSGPLVVLSHGVGDRRQACRFLAPMLAQAGYRVASADLRGHGESCMGWASITRTDVADDLLALIGRLGGPAVIIGHSILGGAATIAAATRPDLVVAVVEINPLTRTQKLNLGALLQVRRYRRCLFLLGGTQLFRSVGLWLRYLNLAYRPSPPTMPRIRLRWPPSCANPGGWPSS
jgi:hypothetical protein